MPIAAERIETNGFRMDYFRFGRGRKTLVILPGLSLQSVMHAADAVAHAYRLLTDDFTICVFDRRRELPAAYTVREMARDTEKAIRSLGPDPVCIFGASQGGMIAMQIAIDCPDLVQKLALGSTCCRVTPAQYRTVSRWIQLAAENKIEELYAAFGEALYPPDVYERLRPYFADAAKTVTREEIDRFICLARGMKDFDVTQELGRITCPTLVIGSSDDRVLGAQAGAQLAERFRDRADCAFYTYDGCGHAAYDTAPDYPERLLRFFT